MYEEWGGEMDYGAFFGWVNMMHSYNVYDCPVRVHHCQYARLTQNKPKPKQNNEQLTI